MRIEAGQQTTEDRGGQQKTTPRQPALVLKAGRCEDRGSTRGEDSDEDRGRAEDDATTTGTRAEGRAGEDRR